MKSCPEQSESTYLEVYGTSHTDVTTANSFSSSNAIKISGYNDIQNPRDRYRVIDFMSLCRLNGFFSAEKAF